MTSDLPYFAAATLATGDFLNPSAYSVYDERAPPEDDAEKIRRHVEGVDVLDSSRNAWSNAIMVPDVVEDLMRHAREKWGLSLLPH